MNKRTILTCGFPALFPVLIVGILMVSGGLAAADKPAKGAPAASGSDTPIATINGQKIPLELFHRFYLEYLNQPGAKDTPEFRNQVFNEFVNVIVTAQDAQQKGLDKDERFAMALEVRRLRLLSRFAVQYTATTYQPSDEELQKAYDEHYRKEKRIEYKARHILVKTEAEAKKLIEKLKGGAKFVKLAKAHSQGSTAKDGGDLSWLSPAQMSQMSPALAEVTAALKPGKYSSKPVQTQYGWHIILLEETREIEPPPLEKVKNGLTLALQEGTLPGYITGLRDQAKVELNSAVIKPVPEDGSQPAAAKTPEKPKS